MLKTFKDYLLETTGKGNYVCIDCEDLGDIWAKTGVSEPVSGKAPPKGDYHCTLIYSKDSSVNPDKIMQLITSMFPSTMTAYVKHFECFDSQEEDKSCIVAEIDNPMLSKMHEFLKSSGMTHSYPEFKPHVTLRYNMSVEEAHYIKDKLNSSDSPLKVRLDGFKSQTINTNYV